MKGLYSVALPLLLVLSFGSGCHRTLKCAGAHGACAACAECPCCSGKGKACCEGKSKHHKHAHETAPDSE